MEMPVCSEGEILLKVICCGICGSDLYKWRNGTVPPGTVLGHEVVAEIVAGPRTAALGLTMGARVAVVNHIPCGRCPLCMRGRTTMCPQFRSTHMIPGGFSEYIKVGPTHIPQGLIPLPPGISDTEATLVEPMGCCIRALERWKVQRGQTVLVMGLGVIGILFGALLRERGVRAVGLDPLEERRRLAVRLGMDEAVSPEQAYGDMRVDGVVITFCSEDTMRKAVEAVGPGGWIGLFAGPRLGLPLKVMVQEIYQGEIDILPSYSTGPDEMRQARDLLAQGRMKVVDLITNEFPLDSIGEAFETAENLKGMKVVVRMG